jgi:hypothetical protein
VRKDIISVIRKFEAEYSADVALLVGSDYRLHTEEVLVSAAVVSPNRSAIACFDTEKPTLFVGKDVTIPSSPAHERLSAAFPINDPSEAVSMLRTLLITQDPGGAFSLIVGVPKLKKSFLILVLSDLV